MPLQHTLWDTMPPIPGPHGTIGETAEHYVDKGPRTPEFRISTWGGPTRINLIWDSLYEASVHIQAAGATFTELRREVISVYEAFSGSGYFHLHTDVPAWHARLGLLVGGTAAAEQALLHNQTGLDKVHENYREAEQLVQRWIHAGIRVLEVGLALEHAVHREGDKSLVYDWFATTLVSGGGVTFDVLLKRFPHVAVILATVKALENNAGLTPALMGRNRQITDRQATRTFEHQADGTLHHYLEQMDRVADHGDIAISVIHRPNMDPAYAVHFPGVDIDGLDMEHGRSPMSLVDGLHNDSEHMAGALEQALDELGVPHGAEIHMTGFSLGGLHASNMARSSGFADRYNLRTVTTIGSPLKHQSTQEGIKVTHFEDVRDPVPHITGERPQLSSERMIIQYNHASAESSVESVAGSSHTWEHNVDAIRMMEEGEDQLLDYSQQQHLDEFRAQLYFEGEIETYVFDTHWEKMTSPEHVLPWEAESYDDVAYFEDALKDSVRELSRWPKDSGPTPDGTSSPGSVPWDIKDRNLTVPDLQE
ncbi:alpha/beta family hydrolase [Nesterenkonia ebinurensis]|uniref:alpha/beta family hydrolase n=1 Tax=Nesterenkonia ebinurensis TaxID=2608252 RepID=UPI00123DC05B|nr:alpha/beta family hydrolase [Nesterenkonia ebinurensis]